MSNTVTQVTVIYYIMLSDNSHSCIVQDASIDLYTSGGQLTQGL